MHKSGDRLIFFQVLPNFEDYIENFIFYHPDFVTINKVVEELQFPTVPEIFFCMQFMIKYDNKLWTVVYQVTRFWLL